MQFVRIAGNLYREGANRGRALKSYQLPTPRVKTESHMPGIMELEVPIGAIEPLTFGYNTVDAHPEDLGAFGMQLHHAQLYTAYEIIQDLKSGQKRERIITMRGIQSENTPDEIAGRGLKGYGHLIKSITEYEDVIEGYGVVARFTFWTNIWDGYGIKAGSNDDNRILRFAGG